MNFRTLDLNLLRVFDVVMAERNLTRAAQRLALTQPAISNALKRLRDTVGEDLLQRTAFGVKPTPKAEALWPAVRSALQQLQGLLDPGVYDPSADTVSFRIAMADATAAMYMPALIGRIEASRAKANLRVLPLTTNDPRALLDRAEADLAVGYFPEAVAALITAGSSALLRRERLHESGYVCVMRSDHPLAERELSLDAYCDAHHLLVSFSGRAHGRVDQALTALNRSRRIALTVNQYFTAGRVVARSDLLTVLPDSFVAATGFKERLVTRPLPFALPRLHIEMLWHMRNDGVSAQQWLRAGVVAAAGEVSDDTAPGPD